MEIYLDFVIQSTYSIGDFKTNPEARSALKSKILCETLKDSDGFVYDIEQEVDTVLNYVEKNIYIGRQ